MKITVSNGSRKANFKGSRVRFTWLSSRGTPEHIDFHMPSCWGSAIYYVQKHPNGDHARRYREVEEWAYLCEEEARAAHRRDAQC